MAAFLELRGVRKGFTGRRGPAPVLRGCRSRDRRRRVRRHHRRVGIGEDDAGVDDRRPAARGRRRDPARGRAGARARTGPRRRLPELLAAAVADDARERPARRRRGAAGLVAARAPRARRALGAPGRTRGRDGEAAGRALGRHAAARRAWRAGSPSSPASSCSTSPSAPSTRSPAPPCRASSRASGASDRRTMLLITNDIDEACLLADRIHVLVPVPDGGARARRPASRSICRGHARAARSTGHVEYRRVRRAILERLAAGRSRAAG